MPLLKTALAKIHFLIFNVTIYALATNREILISQFAVDHLSKNELDAVLWHELGHVKFKHFALKKLARLIGALSSRLAASRAMVTEVERLCEIAADKYALKKVSSFFM